MIDYSRISKMSEYQKKKVWPLNDGSVGPDGESPISVFRRGTRGWEYPWVLEQLSDLPRGSKILDCGCGESGFVEELHNRDFRPTGLDTFQGDEQKRKWYGLTASYMKRLMGKATFIDATMGRIPRKDETFEAATCISVMEHIVIEKKDDPDYHFKCLAEMHRVLKVGGLLICTYDTILNRKVVFAERAEWGPEGWYYLQDIEYLIEKLGMSLKAPGVRRFSVEDIMLDEDAFFVPPDLYLQLGYGSGFDHFGPYHRLTSVGFVMVK